MLAPTGRIWLNDLLRRMLGQKFGRRGELKILPLAGCATEEAFEKTRSFKPPVTKKLGIEWTDDHRVEVHFTQLAQTGLALCEKIVGVFVGHRLGLRRIVEFLFVRSSGHAVILEAGKFSHSRRMEKRPQLFLRSIEAHIAVKIAVNRVARITAFRTPDLLIRLTIAGEGGRTRRRVARRIDRVTAVAAGQTSGRECRERTSAGWPPVEEHRDRCCNRIPAARTHPARGQTFRDNCRNRCKSARVAPRENPEAAEGRRGWQRLR